DGRLEFDPGGELVLDQGAQRLFDYFLTVEGELDARELDAWVAEQLRAELDPQRAAAVMRAWSAYVEFRVAAAAALADRASLRQPEQIEERVLAALDASLGDTPLAAAERRRIEQGFALHRALTLPDADARAAELARLSADETRRFAESRAGAYLVGRRAVERARSSQADPDTIAAIRAQHFDAIEAGAAERLAALDVRRAAWAQRVNEFRAARERLRASFVGSDAELDTALAALDAGRFTAAERRRVHAIARVGGPRGSA